MHDLFDYRKLKQFIIHIKSLAIMSIHLKNKKIKKKILYSFLYLHISISILS